MPQRYQVRGVRNLYKVAPLVLCMAHHGSVCLHTKDLTNWFADDGRGREDGGRKQNVALSPLHIIVKWAVAAWHRWCRWPQENMYISTHRWLRP